MRRLPDPREAEFVHQALAAEPIIIVDCGAAGGIDPIFDRLFDWKIARAVGFEPNPAEFAKLQPTPLVTYLPIAISNTTGRATLHVCGTLRSLVNRKEGRRPSEQFAQIEVDVETLDNISARGVIPRPDIIKIDVEEADYSVLDGSRNILDRIVCVKCEVDWQKPAKNGGYVAIQELMQTKGFLLASVAYNQNLVGFMCGGDVLFLRDVDSLLTLQSSRSIILKLIVTSVALGYLEYARLCVYKAHAYGLLNEG
jgi:FkbM family methyltransferase